MSKPLFFLSLDFIMLIYRIIVY